MNADVKRLSRQEQQQQTRLALLDAAIDLFIERGVEATTFEEVAARAGFTRGAFYSNFESKTDLVVAASERFLELLHAAARFPSDESLDDPGEAYARRLVRLRGVTHDSASMFLAELALYTIRHPEVADAVAGLHQAQLVPAMESIAAAARGAGLDESAVPVTALANVAQCMTFALHLFGQLDPEMKPEEWVGLAMGLIFKGLAAGSR